MCEFEFVCMFVHGKALLKVRVKKNRLFLLKYTIKTPES
jgi:hypothetical protein